MWLLVSIASLDSTPTPYYRYGYVRLTLPLLTDLRAAVQYMHDYVFHRRRPHPVFVDAHLINWLNQLDLSRSTAAQCLTPLDTHASLLDLPLLPASEFYIETVECRMDDQHIWWEQQQTDHLPVMKTHPIPHASLLRDSLLLHAACE